MAESDFKKMVKSQLKSYYNDYEIRYSLPTLQESALLVLNMQKFYHDIAEPIFNNLSNTIRFCRNNSVPIFFTRHSLQPSTARESVIYEKCNGNVILEGTENANFIDEIERELRDTNEVINMNTFNAFTNTPLNERLKQRCVKNVIVTGVLTDVCCYSTAMAAVENGYTVYFSTDATATTTAQKQQSTLRSLAHGSCYMVNYQRLQLIKHPGGSSEK